MKKYEEKEVKCLISKPRGLLLARRRRSLRRAGDGNWHDLSLLINLVLIIIYLINEIIIFPIMSAKMMTLLGKAPYFFIVIKRFYALIMSIGILSINKKPSISWLIINLASIGVISIWFYNTWFYTSIIGEFLLAICAIWLLIITNLKSFVERYKIKRSFLQIILVVVIPIIISGIIYFII
ncbi:MAG: hypothetical protein FWF46_09570 [Oscillospiraceae bacterium]|nr:hypothetical protein [Oscillospiraceae bacterium]